MTSLKIYSETFGEEKMLGLLLDGMESGMLLRITVELADGRYGDYTFKSREEHDDV